MKCRYCDLDHNGMGTVFGSLGEGEIYLQDIDGEIRFTAEGWHDFFSGAINYCPMCGKTLKSHLVPEWSLMISRQTGGAMIG